MALGVHYPSMMKDIILPQAIKSVLPSLVNEFISLLKNTTLIASIGLVDILCVGQQIQSRTYRAFEPFFRHFGVLLCAGAGAFHLGQGA